VSAAACSRGDEGVPERYRVRPGWDQFIPVLAGVAGAANPNRPASELGVDEADIVEFGGQSELT